MRFGIRIPSLKKSLSARLSVKRAIRAKTRAPRGLGAILHPKRALRNKIYNRTTVDVRKLGKRKRR